MAETSGRAILIGFGTLALGLVVLIVAGVWWWSVWELPPEEVRTRPILALTLFGAVLVVVAIWTLVRGRLPERGTPRNPYRGRRRGEPKD